MYNIIVGKNQNKNTNYYCVVFCVLCIYLIIHFLNKHRNMQNKNIYHLSFLFFILNKDKNVFY